MVLFRSTAEALSVSQANDRHQILFARMLIKQAEMQEFLAGGMGHRELVDPTTQLLEQSLSILQPYGESLALGDVLWSLSNIYYAVVGAHNLGQQLRHRALSIYEQHGDRWRIARAMAGLGFDANIRGHYPEAMSYYRRGIQLCEEIGDVRRKGDILNIFGEVHRALGEYAKATQLAQAALATRKAAGNQRGIAFSLYLLGDLAWRVGNNAEALHYSQQSRDLFVKINLLEGLGFALNNLGNIACTLGDYTEARHHFQKVLQANLETNNLENQTVPWVLVGLAKVAHQENQPLQAIELIEHVLHHPRAWQEAKDRAAKLLAELTTELPAEVVAAAQARAKAQELAAAVAELLDDGGTPQNS
jgi:tetratricopeptide (TPR) repeat protein